MKNSTENNRIKDFDYKLTNSHEYSDPAAVSKFEYSNTKKGQVEFQAIYEATDVKIIKYILLREKSNLIIERVDEPGTAMRHRALYPIEGSIRNLLPGNYIFILRSKLNDGSYFELVRKELKVNI